MAKVRPILSNFTRGELSPRMDGRSDVEAYYQGVAELQNFLVLPQGGVTKRPGTVYFAEAEDSTKKSRLISFVIDAAQRYVLELHDGGMRVIKNTPGTPPTRELLTTTYLLSLNVSPGLAWYPGTVVEGLTSGTTAYILGQQSALEYYITEPSGSFTDAETLRGKDSTDTNQDANQGATWPKVSTTTVTSIVFFEPGASFYTEDELFDIKIVQLAKQMAFTHPNHEPKILTYLDDYGFFWTTMNATIPEFQASDTTRVTGLSIRANLNKFGSDAEQESGAPEYKAGTVVEYSGSYYRAIQDLYSTSNPSTEGSNWEVLTGTIDNNPFDTIGDKPAAVGYFQDRLIVGGSVNRPSTVFGSGTGQYEYYLLGPSDADPWAFNLLSERSDAIQWIAAREVLIVGTAGGEWVLGGGNAGITPSNVFAKRQTSIGSANVQGKLINENIVFVQQGGRKFREYYYQNELQAYRARDLTFFSDHITAGGIVDFVFQSDPDPILWAIRGDGVLLGLTYDKSVDVVGWHRHVTDGEIESVATIPGGEENEIWVSVKRTIDGSTVRYLEYFGARATALPRDAIYADSALVTDGGPTFSITAATAADPVAVTTAAAHGLSTGNLVRITDVTGMEELEGRTFFITVTGASTFTLDFEDGTGRDAATAATGEQVYNTISGLSHLEGETVVVSVDGGPSAERTVASGAITLATGEYGNTVVVGIPFTARMKTMNVLAPMVEAVRGRINHVRVRFIETVSAKVGPNDDNLRELIFRTPTTPYGEPAAPFTGEKRLPVNGGYDDDQRIIVESTKPTPCTVAVILPDVGAYQGGQ